MLIVLAAGNLILILQNDVLKKTVEIEIGNLNIVEARVNQVNLGESDIDDIYGLHNVLDDMMKGGSKEEGEKVNKLNIFLVDKFLLNKKKKECT